MEPRIIVEHDRECLGYVIKHDGVICGYTFDVPEGSNVLIDEHKAKNKCRLLGGPQFPRKIYGSRKN